ncbi:hypothetical protein Tco_1370385 [Tanacetum coccineum]
MYPEYVSLDDEHVFSAEEQPLPLVDSPTAESPGYVTESDPEEDLEEYKDDESEDGSVDYLMDGGDDGDDDDGDSSGDDSDDEDADEDEEDEEEHVAPTDSAIVVPIDELVSPPEGTYPDIPPPSTDISTTGDRITVRLQASISLSPEVEVERLLAMTTPSPSPPISLSPPSAGERLARIASTQALIDAVTAALPSPPLLPLPPSLYIPPPVDHKDDIPKFEQPPRKRLCLSTLGSRYEVGESSTTRPIGGRGTNYSYNSHEDKLKERANGRPCFYADFMKCQPLNFKGTKGVVGLTRIFQKIVPKLKNKMRNRMHKAGNMLRKAEKKREKHRDPESKVRLGYVTLKKPSQLSYTNTGADRTFISTA